MIMMCKIFFRLILALTLSLAGLTANADYIFSPLDTLGGTYGSANAISASGQVVGVSTDVNESAFATFWSNGVLNLAPHGATSSSANAINASGQVVGAFNGINAFLWSNGSFVDLGPSGAAYSSANAINASGQVVGVSNDGINLDHASLWSNGSYTDLGVTLVGVSSSANAINDAGQVAGHYTDSTGDHAIWWNNGVPMDLGVLGKAMGINASGQVVGYVDTTGQGDYSATLWDNGVPTDLGAGVWSKAFGINASGQIVGISGSSAALWSNGVLTDLNSLLSPTLVSDGWVLLQANAINDNGDIVGTAYNSVLGITSQAFLLSVAAVPEGDPLVMLLIGLSFMCFIIRRQDIRT